MNTNFKIEKIISLAFVAFLLNNGAIAMNNNFADHPLVNPAKANLSVVQDVSKDGKKIYLVDYMHAETNVNLVVDPTVTKNVSFDDISLLFSNSIRVEVKDNQNILEFGLINFDRINLGNGRLSIDFLRSGTDVENLIGNCEGGLHITCEKRMSFNTVSVRSRLGTADFWNETAITVNNFTMDGDTVSIDNSKRWNIGQGNINCNSFIFSAYGKESNFANFHVNCNKFGITNEQPRTTINDVELSYFRMKCSSGQKFVDLFSNFHRKKGGRMAAEFTGTGPYKLTEVKGDISIISFPNAAKAVTVNARYEYTGMFHLPPSIFM